MKKVAIKVTDDNVGKFLDVVISTNAKPVVSISKEGFLDTTTIVWLVLTDEQVDAFKNNGFTPSKII